MRLTLGCSSQSICHQLCHQLMAQARVEMGGDSYFMSLLGEVTSELRPGEAADRLGMGCARGGGRVPRSGEGTEVQGQSHHTGLRASRAVGIALWGDGHDWGLHQEAQAALIPHI